MSIFNALLVLSAKDLSYLCQNAHKNAENSLTEFQKNRDSKSFCLKLTEILGDLSNKLSEYVKDLDKHINKYQPVDQYKEVLEKLNSIAKRNSCKESNCSSSNKVRISEAKGYYSHPCSDQSEVRALSNRGNGESFNLSQSSLHIDAEEEKYEPSYSEKVGDSNNDNDINDEPLDKVTLDSLETISYSPPEKCEDVKPDEDAKTHSDSDEVLNRLSAVANYDSEETVYCSPANNLDVPDDEPHTDSDASTIPALCQDNQNLGIEEGGTSENMEANAEISIEAHIRTDIGDKETVCDHESNKTDDDNINATPDHIVNYDTEKKNYLLSTINEEEGSVDTQHSDSRNSSESWVFDITGHMTQTDFSLDESSRPSEDSSKWQKYPNRKLKENVKKSLLNIIAMYYKKKKTEKQTEKNEMQKKILGSERNKDANDKINELDKDKLTLDSSNSLRIDEANNVDSNEENDEITETVMETQKTPLQTESHHEVHSNILNHRDYPELIMEQQDLSQSEKRTSGDSNGKNDYEISEIENIDNQTKSNHTPKDGELNAKSSDDVIHENESEFVVKQKDQFQSGKNVLNEKVEKISESKQDDKIGQESPTYESLFKELEESLNNNPLEAPGIDNNKKTPETSKNSEKQQNQMESSVNSCISTAINSEETVIELNNISRDLDEILEKTTKSNESSLNSQDSISFDLPRNPVRKLSTESSNHEQNTSESDTITPLRKPVRKLVSECSSQETEASKTSIEKQFSKSTGCEEEKTISGSDETRKEIFTNKECENTKNADKDNNNKQNNNLTTMVNDRTEESNQDNVNNFSYSENSDEETIIELDDIPKDIEVILAKTSQNCEKLQENQQSNSSNHMPSLQNISKHSDVSDGTTPNNGVSRCVSSDTPNIIHNVSVIETIPNTPPESQSKEDGLNVEILKSLSNLSNNNIGKSIDSSENVSLGQTSRNETNLKDKFELDNNDRDELLNMLNDYIMKSRSNHSEESNNIEAEESADERLDRDLLLDLLEEYHETCLEAGRDFQNIDSDAEELYDIVKEEAFVPLTPSKRGRKKKEITEALEAYKKLLEDSENSSDSSVASLTSESIHSEDLEFSDDDSLLTEPPKITYCTQENEKHGITKELYIKLKQSDIVKLDLKDLPKQRRESISIDRLCDLTNILQKHRASTSTRQGRHGKRARKHSDSSQTSGWSDSNTSSDNENLLHRSSPLPLCSDDSQKVMAAALCEGMLLSSDENDNAEVSISTSGDAKKNLQKNESNKMDDNGNENATVSSKQKSPISAENLKRKEWRKDPLLRGTLSSSDSDSSNKSNSSRHKKRKRLRSKYKQHKADDDSSSSCDSDITFVNLHIMKEDAKKTANKAALQISHDSDSSSSIEFVPVKHKTPNKENTIDIDDESPGSLKGKGRRNIRALVSDEQLAEDTQKANQEEKERIARLEEKQTLRDTFSQSFSSQLSDEDNDALVLDVDKDSFTPLIKVHPRITKKLKPHQKQGIQFMWDSCYESVEQLRNKWEGSGCILAHCMGLGKTLQALALIHTLFTHEVTNTKHVLVVCPLSTVSNWENEYRLAYKDITGCSILIHTIENRKATTKKFEIVKRWRRKGGILVLGYEAFIHLIDEKKLNKESQVIKKDMLEALVDPGPDLIICDEGHLLKNKQTKRNLSLNRVKTRRRIVLTGTPLQNNLMEYYYMVNFVKPNLLGNEKEYRQNFHHPITNGQYEDSTPRDIRLMKQRTYVLHTMLEKTVQRVEDTELKQYLPKLVDYGVFIQISDLQVQFYNIYLENAQARLEFTKAGNVNQKNFLADVQMVKYICSHPYLLSIAEKNGSKMVKEQDVINDNVQNEQEQEVIISKSSWWKPLLPEDAAERLELGHKVIAALSLVEEAVSLGDKVLIFSQNLAEMDCLEHFLNIKGTQNQSTWCKGRDYCRMDGTVPPEDRVVMCDKFNDPSNTRLRLLIMSTKVGGLGLNLTAANRVIIMNVNWNPSYDTQSVFRAFRFGQTKDVYVYRLISVETMEERIYQLQVTKLAIAHRVIDKHQITRHYNSNDIQAMYSLRPKANRERPIPNVPEDTVLAKILQKCPFVYRWHEHRGLLANRPEEDLSEQEKKAAWDEFNKRADEPAIPAKLPSFVPASSLLNNSTAPAGIQNHSKIPVDDDHSYSKMNPLNHATRNLFNNDQLASISTPNMGINPILVAKAIAEAKQANTLRPAAFVLKHGSKQIVPSVLNAVSLAPLLEQNKGRNKALVPNPVTFNNSALSDKSLKTYPSPHTIQPSQVYSVKPSTSSVSESPMRPLASLVPQQKSTTPTSFANSTDSTRMVATVDKNIINRKKRMYGNKTVGPPGATAEDIRRAAAKRTPINLQKSSPALKKFVSGKQTTSTSKNSISTAHNAATSTYQNTVKNSANKVEVTKAAMSLQSIKARMENSKVTNVDFTGGHKSQINSAYYEPVTSPSCATSSSNPISGPFLTDNKENQKRSRLQLKRKSDVSIDLSKDDDHDSTSSGGSLSKDMVDHFRKKGISINMVKKLDTVNNDVINID